MFWRSASPVPSCPDPGAARGRRFPRGARRRRARRGSLFVASLAAVLLVPGCGLTDSGPSDAVSDSAGSAPEAKLLHRVPMAKVGEMAGAMGMWTTRKNFVKADLKSIAGYPLNGGKAAWKIPLDGAICWTSQYPNKAGRIAVLFESERAGSTCTEVGVADLNSGKLLWQKQARDEYGSTESFDEVTIGGSTVAAAGTGGPAAWTIGGRQLSGPGSAGACPDQGYAGDDSKLVAIRKCGSSKTAPMQVRTLDPGTRTPRSSFRLPRGTEYAHAASLDPLVVAVDDGRAKGGSGVSKFLTIDDSRPRGRLLSRIGTTGGKHGKYEPDCPATEVSGCTQLAVDKRTSTLYLSTSDPLGASSEADNDIVAFDLRTGKRTGRVEGTGAGRLIPVGLDSGGKLVAYQESSIAREEGGAVWRVDPVRKKKTKLLQNPGRSYETESRFTSDRRLLYAGGRLYIGSDNVTTPSEVYKTAQPLAVVFGRK